MAGNIENTKKAIGVENLDITEKKALFEKFKQKGGKVIEEEKRTSFVGFDRDKQRKFKEELETRKKNHKRFYRIKKTCKDRDKSLAKISNIS